MTPYAYLTLYFERCLTNAMMENFPDLMRQKYAGSVHFLTERGEHFASIHLTPNHDDSRDDLRKLTYQDALDWIKQSFTLEMSRELSQEEEGKFTWVLMPHTGILFTRAKRDKSFPTEVLDPFCMELPIIRGRYYIAMHRVGCDTGLDVDGSYTRGSDHWMSKSFSVSHSTASVVVSIDHGADPITYG